MLKKKIKLPPKLHKILKILQMQLIIVLIHQRLVLNLKKKKQFFNKKKSF